MKPCGLIVSFNRGNRKVWKRNPTQNHLRPHCVGDEADSTDSAAAPKILPKSASPSAHLSFEKTKIAAVTAAAQRFCARKAKLAQSAIGHVIILVNPSNSVKDITLEQIKKVYTGEITNWKELGGKDGPIVVVSREEGSGTRDSFQEIVGYKSEELVKNASISDGSGSVKTTVAGNKNAIGFASFEYIDDTVSALNVDGIEPTAKNVKEGNYKISRPFLLVTKKDTLTQNGQNLIDFILSSEGQQIVSDNKLITID